MDNTIEAQDNQIGAAAEAVSGGVKAVISGAKSVQQKLILNKAKKLIAAGKANQCTGRMIDICIEAGIDPKVFDTNPVYNARPAVIAAKAAAIKKSGAVGTDAEAIDAAKTEVVNSNVAVTIKKYTPYILGAVVIGLLIYLISKR
jgi:hypothetical protein